MPTKSADPSIVDGTDPVDPAAVDPADPFATVPTPDRSEAPPEQAPAAPAGVRLVRLDDPEQGGDPRYGLSVGEGLIADVGIREYQLPVYDV